ncbi:MAG TPA: hypothetical protein VLW53_24580 [Candidatus Eisenbacteria bacterium]|nr:hypothetical protein [Candidatus Eisenbacteria bacterium]
MDDPFTRCFERGRQLPNETAYRLALARRFSYVLSEGHLLDVVCRYSPLVELGAGTGYWAYLLGLMGADIVAYDQAPPGGPRENRYHLDARPWTEVFPGDATVLAVHRDRALFVCWPPVFSALWEVVRFYAGDVVIYVGDWGHRTARLAGLADEFERIEAHPALALDPAADRSGELSVWRRRDACPAGPNRAITRTHRRPGEDGEESTPTPTLPRRGGVRCDVHEPTRRAGRPGRCRDQDGGDRPAPDAH